MTGTVNAVLHYVCQHGLLSAFLLLAPFVMARLIILKNEFYVTHRPGVSNWEFVSSVVDLFLRLRFPTSRAGRKAWFFSLAYVVLVIFPAFIFLGTACVKV